ncbi:hypothetical protein [Flavobacteriaceae bacterium 14752]|uniref:hypothetical protein n=1 Tax=Mesohalobacter salilacus TaxID=2491711 RepID=UPI000F63D918|nr:hypothetical protein EIG84_06725 [Flavobacteriaceae bacterium 14752]
MKKLNWNLIMTLLAIITLLISIRIIDNQNTVEFIEIKNEKLEKENNALKEKLNELNDKTEFSKWYIKYNEQKEYFEKNIELVENKLQLNKAINDSLLNSQKYDSIFISYLNNEGFKKKSKLLIEKARDSGLLKLQINVNKTLHEIIKNNDSLLIVDDKIIENLNKIIYFQDKQIEEYEIYFKKMESSDWKINISYTIIILLLILNLKIVRIKIMKLFKKL